MEKRAKRVHFQLTQDELDSLQSKVERTDLTRGAFLRAMISGFEVKERPSPELYELLELLQHISINMNQIACKANAMNFVDTAAYWKNVEELEKVKGKLLEVMFG